MFTLSQKIKCSYQASLALQWPPPHVVTATVMITESKETTLVSYCSPYSFPSPTGPHGLELFYMPSSCLRIYLLSMKGEKRKGRRSPNLFCIPIPPCSHISRARIPVG